MGLGYNDVWALWCEGEDPLLFTTDSLAEKYLIKWDKRKEVGPNRYEYIVKGKKYTLVLKRVRGTAGIA